MTTPTTSTEYPYVATVHLGFHFADQAEHATWSLKSDLTNTAHVKGSTITWSPTPAGATVLEPLPAEGYVLAEMIATAEKIASADRDLPVEHLFPDLFSQLKARRGYEEAVEIWRAACAVLDHDASDDE
ncbi:hypothetical protein [Nocardia brasiliensis]|uniref:hypothetical protein n=1 Tax=Nocardia brasiliensis TaxID=37326 RepID=UPI002456BEB1|nr:hypothetical protein [Nocardia brasiliensis]